MSTYDDYISALIHQFWDYAETELLVERELLDSDMKGSGNTDFRRPL